MLSHNLEFFSFFHLKTFTGGHPDTAHNIYFIKPWNLILNKEDFSLKILFYLSKDSFSTWV